MNHSDLGMPAAWTKQLAHSLWRPEGATRQEVLRGRTEHRTRLGLRTTERRTLYPRS